MSEIFQIDAFADRLFTGNPAAVMPLPAFPADVIMQALAAENNLSETAFVVPRADGGFYLRWFTPAAEIEFCGHATIAAAHTMIAELGHTSPIEFHTEIGALSVSFEDGKYTIKAPNYAMKAIKITPALTAAFGPDMVAAFAARNNIYIELQHAQSVTAFQPDMNLTSQILQAMSQETLHGVSIMARGDGALSAYDFVSRHFAPLHGVPEDPVTGSAHSALAPYYAKTLGKKTLLARQCSARGGDLWLTVSPRNVQIAGKATTYMRGHVQMPS